MPPRRAAAAEATAKVTKKRTLSDNAIYAWMEANVIATAAAPKKTAASKTATSKAAASKTAASKAAAPKKAAPAKKAAPKKPATKATTATATTKKAAAPKKTAEPKPAAEPKKRGRKPKAQQPTTSPETETEAEPEVEVKNTANMSRKRKATTESEEPVVSKRAKVPRKGAVINDAPTQILNLYSFGEGSNGELGLGPKAKDVKRPRLNALLDAAKVGVVQVATGGMHALALTHDYNIYSWGVNDKGTLGRDTASGVVLKDMDKNADSDSDSDDDDADMNPLESTPATISKDHFPEDVVITQIAAGDSTSFAVTDDGRVFGWGTFIVSNYRINYCTLG